MDILSEKVLKNYYGLCVRKDLTSYMKRTANVPGYVIEYLLGMYCNTQDEKDVSEGLKKITKALGENYVKPYEIELVKSKIKEKKFHTIIDCLSVKLDERDDVYIGTFSNFKVPGIVVEPELVKAYPKLLTGGVWGFVKIAYNAYSEYTADSDDEDEEESMPDISNPTYVDEETKSAEATVKDYLKKHSGELVNKKGRASSRRKTFMFTDCPYILERFTPIQLASFNAQPIIENRKNFTLEEWMVFVLRSVGIESSHLNLKEKMHYIERLVPLFERNYNLVELGPRGTGKSHVYKEISPYSILLSGGATTPSNLFYNSNRKKVGLVGSWDCIAFDEVTGKTLENEQMVQILKDYMASGSFSRGDAFVSADASLVYIGNINDSVENLLRVSHLFSDFSALIENDSAFFDRIHYYLPGWEVPKLSSSLLTGEYGLICECFAEFAQYMRKYDFGCDFDKYFKLNSSVNIRDEIAIRKTMSGLLKILFPDRRYTESDLKTILNYAIEGRTRVKIQLRKMSGEEFSKTDLGYIDTHGVATVVGVPEKAVDSIIPTDSLVAGHIYTAGLSIRKKIPSLFRMEVKKREGGDGNLITQGIHSAYSLKMSESIKAAWYIFKDKFNKYVYKKQFEVADYMLFLNDLQNRGGSKEINVALFVALLGAALNKPTIKQSAILGSISITGSIDKNPSVVENIRCVYNAGARQVFVPIEDQQYVLETKDSFLDEITVTYYSSLEELVDLALGGSEYEN